MKMGAFWFVCRVVLILVSAAFAPIYMRSQSGDFPEPSWGFPIGMTAICAGAVFFLGVAQSVNKEGPRDWYRPSWVQNPFAFGQPLQTFDSGAYDAMALGIGSLVVGLLSSPASWAWELPLSIGLGLWMGVRITMLAFRDRVADWPV